MKDKYFIFDLDDTLVYELDYLKSAYKEIALSLEDEKLFYQMLEW
jgi:putative hydrolase of the HAD superfamily